MQNDLVNRTIHVAQHGEPLEDNALPGFLISSELPVQIPQVFPTTT